jgi:mannose-1-phosphate guanylyltransferase
MKENGKRPPSPPWSIILAGGRGERLASFTESWLGRPVPKQYCAFVGERSMLQHTLERASSVSRRENIVTVVAREHKGYWKSQVTGGLERGLVPQPVNRDTAAGIFLPLARVRHRDPDATVVLFPSDHFIYPASRFTASVEAAVRAASELPQRVVLLGVRPDDPEPDYGWIFRGRELTEVSGRKVHAVRRFLEKPSSEDARAARAEGALWNTLILAAKADTLWRLGWRYLPQVLFRFESYLEAIGTPEEEAVLFSIYADMPARNFSSDLLQRATSEVAVIELENVLWSDWGRAERIAETLERVGKEPAWETQETLAIAG